MSKKSNVVSEKVASDIILVMSSLERLGCTAGVAAIKELCGVQHTTRALQVSRHWGLSDYIPSIRQWKLTFPGNWLQVVNDRTVAAPTSVRRMRRKERPKEEVMTERIEKVFSVIKKHKGLCVKDISEIVGFNAANATRELWTASRIDRKTVQGGMGYVYMLPVNRALDDITKQLAIRGSCSCRR